MNARATLVLNQALQASENLTNWADISKALFNPEPGYSAPDNLPPGHPGEAYPGMPDYPVVHPGDWGDDWPSYPHLHG